MIDIFQDSSYYEGHIVHSSNPVSVRQRRLTKFPKWDSDNEEHSLKKYHLWLHKNSKSEVKHYKALGEQKMFIYNININKITDEQVDKMFLLLFGKKAKIIIDK